MLDQDITAHKEAIGKIVGTLAKPTPASARSSAQPMETIDLCDTNDEDGGGGAAASRAAKCTPPSAAAASAASAAPAAAPAAAVKPPNGAAIKALRGIIGTAKCTDSDVIKRLVDAGGSLQTATEMFFMTAKGMPKVPGSAPGVGDYVKLAPSVPERTLLDGCVKAGQTGIVVDFVDEEDDDEPYQVMCASVCYWYARLDLSKVSGIDRVMIKSETRQRKASGSTKATAKVSESDPDCVVVQPSPIAAGAKRASIAATPLMSPFGQDDDVQVTSSTDTSADFPHAREHCRRPEYSFVKTSRAPHSVRDGARIQNQKHCPNCYCFVCDVKSSECKQWDTHCMATDTDKSWAAERAKKKGKPVSVPKIGGENECVAPANQAARSNEAGLPSFMHGLPVEHLPVVPHALRNYKAVAMVAQPAKVVSWPRFAGHFDFLFPRCVLHTHSTDKIPMNAKLSSYFAVGGASGAVLLDPDGEPRKGGPTATSLFDAVALLQARGALQVKWIVHHAEREAMTDSVKEKLASLAQHRPATFDLARKYTPKAHGGSFGHEVDTKAKTYADRPAAAEGNETWWECVSQLVLTGTSSSGETIYHPSRRGTARADSELVSALIKCTCSTNGALKKANCCWIRAEIHFEKAIVNLATKPQRDSSHLDSTKTLVQGITPRAFSDEIFTSSVAAPNATIVTLDAEAKELLAAGHHADALDVYTKALRLPVRQRHDEDPAGELRKLCLVGRARARIELADFDGALDDLALVLKKDKLCAEALHVCGQMYMRKQPDANLAAAKAAFHCALTERPDDEAIKSSFSEAAAMSPSVPAAGTSSIQVTNCINESVSLYMVGGDLANLPACTGREWKSPCVVTSYSQKTTRTLNPAPDPYAGRWGRHGGYHQAYITTSEDASDPVKDLGITFKPGSCPPVIQKVMPRTGDGQTPIVGAYGQQDVNMDLKPGMVLMAVSTTGMTSYFESSADVYERYKYSTAGKTHAAVMSHIRGHKRAIKLRFIEPSNGSRMLLGSLTAFNAAKYKDAYYQQRLAQYQPHVKLELPNGSKIVGKANGKDVLTITANPSDPTHYICSTEIEGRRMKCETDWKRLCAPDILKSQQQQAGSTTFTSSEGDLIGVHVATATSYAPVPDAHKFQDIRVLQDSPLFGLSEGELTAALCHSFSSLSVYFLCIRCPCAQTGRCSHRLCRRRQSPGGRAASRGGGRAAELSEADAAGD